MKKSPPFSAKDQVTPTSRVKSLNGNFVIFRGVFTVARLWFHRQRRKWIVLLRGGGQFIADFFEKIQSPFKRNQRICALREDIQALNRRMFTRLDGVYCVRGCWFDQKEDAWVVSVRGGGTFRAEHFRMAPIVTATVTNLRPAYSY